VHCCTSGIDSSLLEDLEQAFAMLMSPLKPF
jgi:hypothetical protein